MEYPGRKEEAEGKASGEGDRKLLRPPWGCGPGPPSDRLSLSLRSEEKQEVPMEQSEPRPESEAPEPGSDDHPSAEPSGPEAVPEDEEKKEVACQGSLHSLGQRGDPSVQRGWG